MRTPGATLHAFEQSGMVCGPDSPTCRARSIFIDRADGTRLVISVSDQLYAAAPVAVQDMVAKIDEELVHAFFDGQAAKQEAIKHALGVK